MTERKKPKLKLRLPLQAYLLYLLLLTIMFTGVTIARFTTSTTSSTGARVAAFRVSASANTPTAPEKAVLDCAAVKPTLNYTLTVVSTSEVAVTYDVIVTLDTALPAGVSMTVDGVSPGVSGAVYTFSNVGNFDPAGGAQDHTLSIIADADAVASEYTGQISIVVRAAQVD